MVASEDFDKFAVVHYDSLTVDDFRVPSNGSRGKSQMLKHKSHDRANILMGDMVNINDREIRKLNKKLEELDASQKTYRKKLLKSLKYWMETPAKYAFELETIDE